MMLEAERRGKFEDAKFKLIKICSSANIGYAARALGMRLDVLDDFDNSRKDGAYPVVVAGPHLDPSLKIQQREVLRVWVNPEHPSEISVVIFREVINRNNGAEIVRGHTLKREIVGERKLKRVLKDNFKELVGQDEEKHRRIEEAFL